MNAADELRKLNEELLVRNAQLEALVNELTEQKEVLEGAEEQNNLLRQLLKEVL